MQPPRDPPPDAAPPAPGSPAPPRPPEPGERRRLLDHPPSDRYPVVAPAAEPGPARRAARALAAGLVGAAIVAFLGGPLSITLGLVGIAALLGWIVGSLAQPSVGLAVAVAIGSVGLGLVGVWLFARFEGGVLSLPDYFAQVDGPLPLVVLGVAGLVAAATAR